MMAVTTGRQHSPSLSLSLACSFSFSVVQSLCISSIISLSGITEWIKGYMYSEDDEKSSFLFVFTPHFFLCV